MKYFTPGGVSGKQGFVPWYPEEWKPRDETLYFLAKVYTPWQKLEQRDKRGYYAENYSLYAKYYGVCIGFHDILKKTKIGG